MTGISRRSLRRELVLLLADEGHPIGTAPKATVHTASTPLHRAFSCYLFSPTGQLLLTCRAKLKHTFPGSGFEQWFWSPAAQEAARGFRQASTAHPRGMSEGP